MEEQVSKSYKWVWAVVIVLVVLLLIAWLFYQYSKLPPQVPQTNNMSTVKEEFSWSTMQEGPYNDSVSYATSKDLVNWTDSGEVLAEHASVPDAIVDKNGTIYIYFVDVSQDGIAEQLGMIKSSDNGKTWSDKVNINIEGIGNKIAVDPDPYLLPDGRVRLYYFDIETTKTDPNLEKNTIYSAISEDGVSFIQEDGYRLKYPAIFDPDVVYNGEEWLMYAGTDKESVVVATSSDGLNFTYDSVAYTGGAIPNVIFENGQYTMYVGGIQILSSQDGKTFQPTGNMFETGGSGITADPGVVKLQDGSYFMVYKTAPFKDRPMTLDM